MQPVSRPTDVEGEVLGHDANHAPTSRTAAGGEGGIVTVQKLTVTPDHNNSSTKLMVAVLAGNLGIYFGLVILARFGLVSGTIAKSIRDYVTLLAR